MNEHALENTLLEIVEAVAALEHDVECLKSAIGSNPELLANYREAARRLPANVSGPLTHGLRSRLEAIIRQR